jgi:hypothetical protein
MTEESWQDQPPLTKAVVTIAGAMVTVATDGLSYSMRMSSKAETFLDESIGFLQDARPLVVALSKAVDSGMIEDTRRMMRIVETTVNQVALVNSRLDAAVTQLTRIIPTVEKTAHGMRKMLPVIEGLPATQDDIRVAREAVQRVETLVDLALEQIDAIPGARLMRDLSGGIAGGIASGFTGGRKPKEIAP